MKTATACTDISVDVHCPHCEEYFDALDQLEDLREHELTCNWVSTHHEVECPECKEDFVINKIAY